MDVHKIDVHKIGIKYFLSSGADVDADTWFRIFNTWIPVTTDEILIDVADYSHVHNGPVTLLVGHNSNYGIDRGEGRLGLLTTRKQPLEGGFEDRFRTCLGGALKACARLENEADLKDRAHFDCSMLQVVLNDRLNAPNTAETLKAVKPGVESALQQIYTGADLSIEHRDTSGSLFALDITVSGDWNIDKLMKNMPISA
jgi:hypothetical protein